MTKVKKKAATSAKETLGEYLKRKSNESVEEFELPSGMMCRMEFFSTKKAKLCQKISTKGEGVNASMDEDLMYAAMVAETCEFQAPGSNLWERMIAENIDGLLPGMDYMMLQGKLSGVSLQTET